MLNISNDWEEEAMTVDLKLSLHPDEIYKKSDLELEYMSKELSQLAPISEGQVVIGAIYSVVWEDNIEIGYYLRNATQDTIFFSNTPLKVLSANGEVLNRQVIDLTEMGNIPPHSARPWRVFIDKSRHDAKEEQLESCTIEFDVAQWDTPYTKVITEDKQPTPLTQEQLTNLGKFLRSLPPVQQGYTTVDTFAIEKNDAGELLVSIVVRHGMTNPMLLSRFQLAVLDQKNRCVARAVFNIEEHPLEAGSFFMRTFAFPIETILISDIAAENLKISMF